MKAAGRGWMRESLRNLDYVGDLRGRYSWGNGSHFARSSFILAKQNAYPHISIATLFSGSSEGEFCLSTEAVASSPAAVRIRHVISSFGSKILACTMPKWPVSAVKHKKLSFCCTSERHLAVMNHRSRLSMAFNHPWTVKFLESCDLSLPFSSLGFVCKGIRDDLQLFALGFPSHNCIQVEDVTFVCINRYQINWSC
jgi:hypothetical protein